MQNLLILGTYTFASVTFSLFSLQNCPILSVSSASVILVYFCLFCIIEKEMFIFFR